ncbi:hypothetical protein C8J55DRAFT_526986 [Lentinula edodes]|uniref:Secreted protein n=1 Tax=Lentinula lateritia TaxID=40482 RepID=A0A9W8ZUN8_9AGAR|nr:hypothetical protein C8J55DRAFT_526986 [Lentinula edodes]
MFGMCLNTEWRMMMGMMRMMYYLPLLLSRLWSLTCRNSHSSIICDHDFFLFPFRTTTLPSHSIPHRVCGKTQMLIQPFLR